MNPDEINRGCRPVPTARYVDHVALTVPDLPAAVSFFVEVLGARLVYTEDVAADEDWMTTNLGVPSGTTGCRIAMLRWGPSLNVELFRYDTPSAHGSAPRNCDVGGHHLALTVTDFDAAHRHLADSGRVEFRGAPKTIPDGPLAGTRWTYFRSDWGLELELMAPPSSLPYERGTTERKARPDGPGNGS